jgi:hypothetical protein
MKDRTPTRDGAQTMTAPRDAAVDGSSHAVHTDDIAQRFDDAHEGASRRGAGGARAEQGGGGSPRQTTPVVADEERYRTRWQSVQAGFVDEPRRAVEQADALVAEVINEMISSFADERGRLEAQWSQGKEASTEDLRIALQRYRSFFDRLIS